MDIEGCARKLAELEMRLCAVEQNYSVAKIKEDKIDAIYTDGSCSGNPGPGGWGVVNLDQKKYWGGYEPKTTNNRMELLAVVKALQSTDTAHCNVFSDSRYVVDGVNKKWYVAWKANGWKTTKKSTVKNIDLWTELIVQLERLQPTMVWVRGHQRGEKWNNFADALASECMKKQSSTQGSIDSRQRKYMASIK